MKRIHCLAGVALAGAAFAAFAQSPPPPLAVPAPVTADDGTPPAQSALDGELFLEILLGEINARSGEPGAGYSLMLDAARKADDPALYKRAIEIALQSRSGGDAALLAARAWKQAQPDSRDANRYLLQILIALNRLGDTVEPLKAEIALTDAKDRALAMSVIPLHFARASDKKLAASLVEQALGDYLAQAETGAAAWTAVGRMRLAAGDLAGALEAGRRGQSFDAAAEGPALLALELMDAKQPLAEPIVARYLTTKPLPEVRMAYVRALLDAQRYTEGAQQLQIVTQERPDYPEAWLVMGTLQLQDKQLAQAQASLQRYLELANGVAAEERNRGLVQAYLSLAQIAETRKDYAAAESWLGKIENSQDLVSAQLRRASILGKQGRLEEGRKLIQELPELKPGDARMKVLAEVQLLRDSKQYVSAYQVLTLALAREPDDVDLLYDQAMLAEKLNKLDDMERLLRQVIAVKPDFQHAYNALGYSMAERNVRLPEARQLIRKALEYAPGDPFISDSLGWVEFRMGNKQDAARILESAYKSKPDPEIAAHLGEVLWSLGQRDKASAIWKEGLLLDGENETLQATLKRLHVRP